MSNRVDHTDCSFGWEQLESAVRAAGNYVQPSDDLRPKTLEAATHDRSQRIWARRLGSAALALVLLVVTGLPGRILHSDALSSGSQSREIRQFDLHEQAATQRMLKAGWNSGWALLEAFLHLRQQQAELFDESK